MSRYIRLEKLSSEGQPAAELIIHISDSLTDDEIVMKVSEIKGSPIGNTAFEVFEPNGDIRLYHQSQWHFTTAISQKAIEQMLADE